MNKKNLNVHFIGINGSGISGVACIAKNKGFNVSGCDLNKEGNYTNQLIANNINIQQGHSVDHLKNIDLVVLSPALLYKDKYKEIPETKLAMETMKTIKWQQFLGEYIMKNQNIVAVAGTHGKTTTTTLTALMLEKANFDPTVFVGGEVKEWGQNYRIGESNYFVCEADEYDSNFLYYNPKYVILNNLEMEHPESFENFEKYKNNFINFLKTIQENGKLVFHYDDENVLNLIIPLIPEFKQKNIELIAITFTKEIIFNNKNIKLIKAEIINKNKVIINNKYELEFQLLGEHNIKNIVISSILSIEIGANIKDIQEVVKNFTGSKRRLDLIFSNNRIKLYDDYAHHQTQVYCTLKALKNNIKANEEIIAILEPHLISRIKNNRREFEDALMIADYPIITKIYKSRESFMDDTDVIKLLKNDKITYIEDHNELINTIIDIISKSNNNFSIIVMGAGNSYKIANNLKEKLSSLQI